MDSQKLPDEEAIGAFIEEELPEGVQLVGIHTGFGSLAPGMPEQFNVEIILSEDEDLHPFGAPGLGHAITQRIRRRWPPEAFCITIRSSLRTSEEE